LDHGWKTDAGTVVYDPANPSADQADAAMDAASINPNNEKRDAHLRSPDFFDSAEYRSLAFHNKRAWEAGRVLVGEEISITIDVEAVKQKPAAR